MSASDCWLAASTVTTCGPPVRSGFPMSVARGPRPGVGRYSVVSRRRRQFADSAWAITAAPEADFLDRTLLRLLMRDGRATQANLAVELGLTAPAVAQRVRRLQERGVIRH